MQVWAVAEYGQDVAVRMGGGGKELFFFLFHWEKCETSIDAIVWFFFQLFDLFEINGGVR